MKQSTVMKSSALLLALFVVSASQSAEAKRLRFRSSPSVVVVHTSNSSYEERNDQSGKSKNPWAKDPAPRASAAAASNRAAAAPKGSGGGALLVMVLAGMIAVVGIGWHLLKSSLDRAAARSGGHTPGFDERLSTQLAELRQAPEPMLNGAPVRTTSGFGRKSS